MMAHTRLRVRDLGVQVCVASGGHHLWMGIHRRSIVRRPGRLSGAIDAFPEIPGAPHVPWTLHRARR